MVEYQCNKCSKKFIRHGDYDRHLARKTPCTVTKNIDKKIKIYKCKYCDTTSNRIDVIDRHTKTCANNTMEINIKNNKNKNKNGTQVITTGNYNNITIKQYNLFPFGKDGIDCLTTPEKIAIFSSDENPMEMIIVKVNPDSVKINHHNVGYTDEHNGYGIIFDGDSWLTERIDVIMEILFESKEKDLLKIYNEIKDFLSDHDNNTIKNTLDDLNKKINPRNRIDVASKKNLIAHLKKHFYNNRNLVIEAKHQTENNKTKSNNCKNKLKNILKDGFTVEDVDKIIKLKKINDQKIILKKEMAKDLLYKLDEINNIEKEPTIKFIDQVTDINILKIIIRLLSKTYCFRNNFNTKMIQSEIIKEEEINNFLFTQ